MRWIREHKLITGLLVILLALVLIFVLTAGEGEKNGMSGAVNKGMMCMKRNRKSSGI